MDILTQYYNSAGQIVSKSPDLLSREFYRDYVCRHRFNEMFTLGSERNKIGSYKTATEVAFMFGSGEDSATPVLHGQTDGSTTYPASYAIEKDASGEFCVATKYGEHTSTSYDGLLSIVGNIIPSISTGIDMEMIFSSPDSVLSEVGSTESIVLSLSNDNKFCNIGIHFSCDVNGYYSILTAGFSDGSNNYAPDLYSLWNDWSTGSRVTTLPQSLTDGSKNILGFSIGSDHAIVRLNGTTLYESDYTFDFLGSINGQPIDVTGDFLGIWSHEAIGELTKSRLYSQRVSFS